MSLTHLSGRHPFGGASLAEQRAPRACESGYAPGSWAYLDSFGGRIWRSDRLVLNHWGTQTLGVWVDRRAFDTRGAAEEHVQRQLGCSADEARAYVGNLPVRFA